MNLIHRTAAATCAAAALLAAGAASAAPVLATGGGYTATATAYNFRDISGTGTAVFNGSVDDSVSGAIDLGFAFNFFGVTYTQAWASSNGFLTFTPNQGSGCCNGGALPGFDSIGNVVAGWWTDLVAGPSYNSGSILARTIGTPGSRTFVLEYLNTRYFSQGAFNTFEILLHEGSNDIELQYASTSGDSHTRSVGIENASQTAGLQLLQDNSSTFNQRGILISNGLGVQLANATTAVPEPGALGLAAVALAGLLASRRRRA